MALSHDLKRFAPLTTGVLLMAGSFSLLARPASRPEPAMPLLTPIKYEIKKPKSTLEMVFVVDTTGSMSGLIEGAKRRIWGIINDVMKMSDRPNVRVGLVAYRDHGDEYVTKVLPLTNDLDKVYSTLMDYRADGGGDTPEDVRRALAEGVSKAGWSRRAPRLAQVVFLVGDAPPHDDYQNEPSTLDTAAKAIQLGIAINTIQCGSMAETTPIWKQIASRGEGKYFAVPQDSGVAVIETPYDGQLGQLGNKLGQTYAAYGGGGGADGSRIRSAFGDAQYALEAKVSESAPKSAAADRAVNKVLNGNAYSNDLYQSLENGSVTLDKVKSDDLPDNLKKLSPEARKQKVALSLQERKKIRSEITALAKKRDAYLISTRKKQSKGKQQVSFDQAVANALKLQMAQRGIK